MMAIIGILSVIGIGSFTQATVKSKDTQRKNDLNQIAKALEVYYNDVGSYPAASAVVGEEGKILCSVTATSTTCNPASACTTRFAYCFTGKTSVYLSKLPEDSSSLQKYYYKPDSSLSSFALYAALENTEDKDIVVISGTTDKTNWDDDGVNCGSSTSVPCNYKITETGLVRAK